jgi:hypothetical protein
MKPLLTIGTLVFVLLLTASSARAQCIFQVSGALTPTDPVQHGRLSRNAIPQDWSGTEAFPGVINPTVGYHYHAYRVPVRTTPFVQISVDSVSPYTFVSAYDTSYNPDLGFALNWLGDAGFSGNFPSPNPIFFQVNVPQNHDLLVVVNNTATANVGVGDPFQLMVEGFADSQFTARVQGRGLCAEP